MYPYYYSFSPFHVFGDIIGWVLVIWLILWLVRGPRRHWMDHHMGHGAPGRDPGMDVLRERYAKGEITKEEFDAKKKDLMSS